MTDLNKINLELEIENQRLRKALEDLSKDGTLPKYGLDAEHWEWGNADDSYRYGKEVEAYNTGEFARKILSQPTPTTGLVEVVKAAIKSCKSVSEATEPLGWDTLFTAYGLGEIGEAIKALPPEIKELMEI